MIKIILEVVTDFFSGDLFDIITTTLSIFSVCISIVEKISKTEKTEKTEILKAPGFTFYFLGKVIFTKKSYERVVEPAITMMQEEYFEAYSQKRYAMACWIQIRFFFIFLQIVGMNLPLITTLLEIKEKFTSK